VGHAYEEARAGIRQAPVTYTDDTSWAVGGEPAQLMVFDTDQATVYQIRPQHRNQEVRELVPGDYRGTLVTDRGPSYEADALAGVDQQKCLSHLMRNVKEVVATKSGRARQFGEGVLNTLKQANQLWRDHRALKVDGEAFWQQGQELEVVDSRWSASRMFQLWWNGWFSRSSGEGRNLGSLRDAVRNEVPGQSKCWPSWL
jgi:hypothetical protein